MDSLSYKKNSCRVCTGANLAQALSLGKTPPANAFLKKEDLGEKNEQFFPLELQFCNDCSFVQLADVVSPELLFRDYVYVSSTSPVFVKHFEDLAQEVSKKLSLPQGALIVDIGSNDGILLRPFQERGMRVLGIDPAVKIAEMATKGGIETWPEFFSPTLADKIIREKGAAHLVTATSVFPHIDDLDAVVAGVKTLLHDEGVFMVEAYYLADLMKKNLFDTIYHEHLSYFRVGTIAKLFERLGMQVFDVEVTDTHGGSLRVFAQKTGGSRPVSPVVREFITKEEEAGMHLQSAHAQFADSIADNKRALTKLLNQLKKEGAVIAGYGAPAKGNTLLNYFNIGPEILDYIVDDSAWKQGLYTPGTHIPVESSKMLEEKWPDYLLILAWNFAESIMKKQAAFHEAGGKFIIPVPMPRVI